MLASQRCAEHRAGSLHKSAGVQTRTSKDCAEPIRPANRYMRKRPAKSHWRKANLCFAGPGGSYTWLPSVAYGRRGRHRCSRCARQNAAHPRILLLTSDCSLLGTRTAIARFLRRFGLLVEINSFAFEHDRFCANLPINGENVLANHAHEEQLHATKE